MAMLDELLVKAKDVARKAEEKTDDLIEIARLRYRMNETEKEISATMEGIGRLVYDQKRAGAVDEAIIAECCDQIDRLNAKREALLARLMHLKNAARCSACGEYNSETAAYCSRCGGKM